MRSSFCLSTTPWHVSSRRARWQTDVLASLAIGTGIGWYAHGRELPISVELLPHGISREPERKRHQRPFAIARFDQAAIDQRP